MKPRLSVLPRRSISFDPPRIGPSLAAAAFALAMTAAFGWMATAGLTGRLPSLLGASVRSGSGFRILTASLGFLGGIAGLLALLTAAGKAWNALKFRTGLLAVLETEGECTIRQEGNGLWGLELALGGDASSPSPRLLASQGSLLDSGRILFRLREAEAAKAARLFRPGQVLQVRWCDAPLSQGGATVLEIRSREEAALASPGHLTAPLSGNEPGEPDFNEEERRAA